jgi:hypothetical protein
MAGQKRSWRIPGAAAALTVPAATAFPRIPRRRKSDAVCQQRYAGPGERLAEKALQEGAHALYLSLATSHGMDSVAWPEDSGSPEFFRGREECAKSAVPDDSARRDKAGNGLFDISQMRGTTSRPGGKMKIGRYAEAARPPSSSGSAKQI